MSTYNFRCNLDTRTKLGVNWRSSPLKKEKQAQLEQSSCSAVSPKGKTYNLRVINKTYPSETPTYWSSANLELIDNSSPEKSIKWRNGTWKLNLAFKDEIPRESITTNITFTTFYYNPLLHGPPN